MYQTRWKGKFLPILSLQWGQGVEAGFGTHLNCLSSDGFHRQTDEKTITSNSSKTLFDLLITIY